MDILDVFRRALGSISGGRVLDVATQEGGFVTILMENLGSYTEITGIDCDEDAIQAARSTFEQENIHFIPMDAEYLDFEDQSFDTVNVSASLHHLANVPRVLAEMRRVLRPGGHFVVSEMHRDAQTEAQLTIVQLHHWAAEIDTALGIPHNRTLARREIVDFVASLDLDKVVYYDFDGADSDPADDETIKRIKNVIDERIQRTERLPDHEAFKRRGEEIKRRLHEVGVQWEPVVVIVGMKR
jgi:SAM-dependent methyltransferase